MAQVQLVGLDQVLSNLRKVGISTIKNVFNESERTAAEMENYSKDARPWTDRTGNARRSIYGFVTADSENITIYHGIGVNYGVFLELANGGRYRVIGPTANTYRTIWLNRLKGTLSL